MVSKAKDINREINPLVAPEFKDRDPCVQRVSHNFLRAIVEDYSAFDLLLVDVNKTLTSCASVSPISRWKFCPGDR